MKNQNNSVIIKEQKEKIENRLLTIFATALGAEMLLMYLFNWFNPLGLLGTVSSASIASFACYALMTLFFLLGIYTVVRASLLKKAEETLRSKKYMNWFYVCLAGFLSCLFIWPTEILTKIFRVNPMSLNGFNNFHPFFADNGVQFRAGLVMALVAIYTVVAFIVYGIKSASLGKEKK